MVPSRVQIAGTIIPSLARNLGVLLACCIMICSQGASSAQTETSPPLQFLKQQERKNKDQKGEVYLGKVLTLIYPAYAADPHQSYHLLLLEMTDVLKTPLRANYRLVLKGYSDDRGSPEDNLGLSRRRANILKKTLVRKYFMEESRITAEGFGARDPVAPNDTPEGRKLNRRVEIHVYGDVSEAVRFVDR
jgi:hypothetical protein